MNQVVDMREHFDVDATLEAIAKERFAMQPAVIAALRQAAAKSAQKLLNLVSSDDFGKLPVDKQVRVFELVFDRAYGKAETASSSMVAMHKTGNVSTTTDHSRDLDRIEQRMQQRSIRYPELSKARLMRQRNSPETEKGEADDIDQPDRSEPKVGQVIELPKRR